MPKVFVIQNNGKNLAPAQEYGEIEIMLHNQELKYATALLKRKLQDFEFGDYLLLIGNPVFIGVAVHIVLTKQAVVNCLVWDRDHYRYNVEKVES